jgi:hypothetical protein
MFEHWAHFQIVFTMCGTAELQMVVLSNCLVLLTDHHAMKAYWGSGGIAPHILDLSTRWRSVVSFTPWPLYMQRKSPWHPLARRLGGPLSWYGHGDEKNSQPLLRLKPPIIQPRAQHYTSELSQLQIVSYVYQI